MRYGLRDLDVDGLPERLVLEPDEDGLGVVLRAHDRLVGFRMVARPNPAGVLDPHALVDEAVREAAAVERLRAEIGAPPGDAPSLTVAICSKDGWALVNRLLGSLAAVRDEQAFEVLVIDNASADDRLREVCAAHDGVRYVREALVGLDFARNCALREAHGAVVAFLDDDVVVDRNWLWAIRRAWAENPDAGCVTGLVLPMALDTEAQILFEMRGGFRRGFRPFRFAAERYGEEHYPCGAGHFGAGANMSVRRDLVLRLGGFDEALDTGRSLPGGGDLDLFYRVLRSGAMLVYEPQAAVYHEHRRELAGLRRQYYTWGLGFAAFITKSMRTDRAMAVRFCRMIVWWFAHQTKRLVRRLIDREPTPIGMILGEILGGIVGLSGEYARSERRVAAIRASRPR